MLRFSLYIGIRWALKRPENDVCTDAHASRGFLIRSGGFPSARALFSVSCSGALGKWSLGAQSKFARRQIRSDGWFFLFFSLFCCTGLDSGLGFPPFVISKYKFLSGALPLGTPRAISAARPHFLIVAPYSQFGP